MHMVARARPHLLGLTNFTRTSTRPQESVVRLAAAHATASERDPKTLVSSAISPALPTTDHTDGPSKAFGGVDGSAFVLHSPLGV